MVAEGLGVLGVRHSLDCLRILLPPLPGLFSVNPGQR